VICASWILIAILSYVLIYLLENVVIPVEVRGEEPVLQDISIAKLLDFRLTTLEQDSWINRLGLCESGNNQNAVNPLDLDGTASHGMYQFKIGTWKTFVQKYDLWNWREWEAADWSNTMMSDYHQTTVLQHMVNDTSVDFSHQFPSCTRKLGWPPKR